MKVLVTESIPAAGTVPGAILALDGHDVAFCHPAGADVGPAPCVGLAVGGRCPLRPEVVDLVVDVRPVPGPFTMREAGAMCAVRTGVPLLIAGRPPAGSTLAGEAMAVCEPDELLAACAKAVAPTGPIVRRAVAEAVTPIARRLGENPDVRLLDVDGTVQIEVSLLNQPGDVVTEDIRRAAWLAFTRATRGKIQAEGHITVRAKSATY
ncbi:hypothetical protein Aph01nite_69640 [Acrocarpospora phusangensis]|uniref:Uncharacterized protein n=1 Tax=Acrocarpospora phusangensis TaxID=1070424 RepID=A0A919UP99_9ACTN|nr:hypothetical protein [Acrocarpospora phusangensis]GIH28654.1 hypothetical protein Aph01nite_69640 [Acrocarpospora phusangensis]